MPGGARALSNVPFGLAIAAGLQGAWLMARARPYGLLLFETTPAGAARSFLALVFCLPVHLVLRFSAPSGPVVPPRVLMLEVLGFIIMWFGFLLLSHRLASAIGREDHWPRFLAAWNWSQVVQYAALFLVTVPLAVLGVPSGISQALGLAVFGYAIWLEWYVVRLSLGLPGVGAAGFVLLDLAMAVIVSGIVQRLSAS